MLAVIHALEHWRHYLQGTVHPVTLLTDHKNLTYFRQPQKLSRHQARWMMFLQDFDLHFVHIPGSAMGPADALSRLPDPDTSSDNVDVTVLPDDLFIHAIDIALVDKISSSSSSDPLVVSALQNLSVGSPLFPHSSLSVTVLFPHRSVLLFFHTRCLLTWRGRRLYTHTSYLFICTVSSFCFFDLSTDLANS